MKLHKTCDELTTTLLVSYKNVKFAPFKKPSDRGCYWSNTLENLRKILRSFKNRAPSQRLLLPLLIQYTVCKMTAFFYRTPKQVQPMCLLALPINMFCKSQQKWNLRSKPTESEVCTAASHFRSYDTFPVEALRIMWSWM